RPIWLAVDRDAVIFAVGIRRDRVIALDLAPPGDWEKEGQVLAGLVARNGLSVFRAQDEGRDDRALRALFGNREDAPVRPCRCLGHFISSFFREGPVAGS